MDIVILILMCICKMIWLSLPTLLLLVSVQAIVYKITGISLYNKLVKKLEAVNFGDGTTSK